ncbi:MAG: MFS transporter [Parvibaculum sp.]|nr:MFS transporter [Parvibaculum sp.]
MNEHAISVSDRRRGIVSAIASLTAVAMGLGASLPLLALELDRQGVSPFLNGLSATSAAVGGLLVTPFLPKLIQLLGTRRLLLTALWLSIGCLMACYALPNVWMWFPIRFMNGAALVILFVLSETLINQLAEEATRGRLIGLYATVLSIGFAIGPAILVSVGGVGLTPYLIIAVLMALASIPIWLAGPAMSHFSSHDGPRHSVLAFIRIVPTVTFAAFTFGALEQGTLTLMPIYGIRVGLSEQTAALVLSAFAAGNIVSQIPLGFLADRFDRRLLLIICALVGAVAIAMLPLVQGTILVMPVIFIFGGVTSGLYTVGLTLLGQRIKGSDLAAANAAFVMMYNFGGLAGPAIGGVAMQLIPPHGLPLAFSVMTLSFAGVAGWRYFMLKNAAK